MNVFGAEKMAPDVACPLKSVTTVTACVRFLSDEALNVNVCKSISLYR